MKKYLLYIPVVLTMMGVASCSQDRDPVYHAPTEGSFKLNNPAMMNQEIDLSAGYTLEFSCSQPDYGFAAPATYSMDMALSQDFANSYTLTPLGENSTIISVDQGEVATGICVLLGLDSEETFNERYPEGVMPAMEIFFRANCRIGNIESSYISSNVVSYKSLVPYFNVAVPGAIYIIGDVYGDGNWTEPAEGNAAKLADWRLFEDDDAIGSKIYKGSFEMPAGVVFRFYSALTGWDGGDSYGTQVDDNAIEFPDFNGGDVFEHELVKGKGSFSFPNWPGGTMNMVVNMADANNMTVTFSSGDTEIFVASYIYVVGNYPGEWIAPSEVNKDKLPSLKNSQGAENIYTGYLEFDAAKDLWFRFATKLGDGDASSWDNSETIGWQEPDEGATFDLTNNAFHGDFVQPGSGSWNFNLPEAGKFNMTVDFDNMTVDYLFEPAE